MKSMYLVMSGWYSPICIAIPTPKFVFANRKDAQKFCDAHNAKRNVSTEYYVRKVQFMEGV